MPEPSNINPFVDAFLKRGYEEREAARALELAKMQDATSRRGQDIQGRSIDIQALAQEASERQFDKEQERLKAAEQFLQMSRGQELIGSGKARLAVPGGAIDINPEGGGLIQTPPDTEAGASNYGGQMLKTIPLLDQLRSQHELQRQFQIEQQQQIHNDIQNFAMSDPEWATENKDLLRKVEMAKITGFNIPIHEDTLGQAEVSASRKFAELYSKGNKDPEDPQVRYITALIQSLMSFKPDYSSRGSSQTAQANLNAKQQATELLQYADTILVDVPVFAKAAPHEKQVMRRDTMRKIQAMPGSNISSEALRLAITSLGTEPNPPDPTEAWLLDLMKQGEEAKKAKKK